MKTKRYPDVPGIQKYIGYDSKGTHTGRTVYEGRHRRPRHLLVVQRHEMSKRQRETYYQVWWSMGPLKNATNKVASLVTICLRRGYFYARDRDRGACYASAARQLLDLTERGSLLHMQASKVARAEGETIASGVRTRAMLAHTRKFWETWRREEDGKEHK